MLSTRALRKVSSVRDIMQALSILSHLDSMNLLYQVDESAWRSLIIACNNMEEGYFKGNLMKLLMVSMQSAGVSPNVLTSTQRNSRVDLSPRSKSSVPSGSTAVTEKNEKESHDVIMDTFNHLEELGLAWFAQKIMPFDGIPSPSPDVASSIPAASHYYDSGPKSFQLSVSASTSSPVAPPSSTMRRFSNIFKKNSVEQHMVRKVRRKSVKASVASVESANFMRLVQNNSSYFSLQRPPGSLTLFSVPLILSSEIIGGLKSNRFLSCIKSEDIEGKVHEVRDIFNKIQKLKLSEGPSSSIVRSDCTARSVISGEVTVDVLKASGLNNCNSEGCHIGLTSVYARIWTTSSPKASVKTAPGIPSNADVFVKSVDGDGDDSSDQISEEKTNVSLKIKDIVNDEVLVELFGDMKSDDTESCHLFDQSLGVGKFSLGAVSQNRKTLLDLQLLSLTREKKAVVHISTKLTCDFADCHSTHSITSQSSMESFFDTQGSAGTSSHTGYVPSRPASLGGGETVNSTGSRQPEIVKKTWKQRLSFGLYKDQKGGDMGSDRTIDSSGPSTSTTHIGSITPPPSMKQIEEAADENDLQEVVLKLDLDETSVVDDDAHIQGDVESKQEVLVASTVVLAEDISCSIAGADPDADTTTSPNVDPLEKLRTEIQSAQDRISQKMTDLENASRNVIQKQRGAVGIYCCSPCLVCSYCMLDDEMMAAWAGFPSLSGGRQRGSVEILNEQDIVKAHMIVCVKCQSNIKPLLHIQQYAHIFHGDSQGNDEGSSSLSLQWQTTVPHLSPFGVRFSMESMIAENGTDMLKSEWLIKNYPLLYWNMLWYSTRLDLPSGFMPCSWSSLPSVNKEDIQPLNVDLVCFGPVLISWRECTVVAKVKRLLCDYDSELSIADIFPVGSESELDLAEKIITSMDGSLDGISKALTQCAHLKSLQACFYETPARGLYLTFLMLVHFYKPRQLVNFQTNNIYMDLSKVVGA